MFHLCEVNKSKQSKIIKMNTTTNIIAVDTTNYEVYEFMDGYFGICEKGRSGANCVFGGDSANEDDYNEEYITNVFNQWDGQLVNGVIENN